MNGTRDNVLDLLKYVKEQKLQYVLAVWSPKPDDDKHDNVTLYTSFEKNEIKKLSKVLLESVVIEESKEK